MKRQFTKEGILMANMHNIIGLRNMQIKTAMCYHNLQTKMVEIKDWPFRMHRKVCSHRNSYPLLVRIQCGILENNLTVIYKFKHTIKMQFCISTHRHLLSGNKHRIRQNEETEDYVPNKGTRQNPRKTKWNGDRQSNW